MCAEQVRTRMCMCACMHVSVYKAHTRGGSDGLQGCHTVALLSQRVAQLALRAI